MSRIGNNLFFNREPRTAHRKPNSGFTLIEIMVTVAVLSVGIIVIYQTFFISLDVFARYGDVLRISYEMDEIIWRLQNDLVINEALFAGDNAPIVMLAGERMDIRLNINYADEDMYMVGLHFIKPKGKTPLKISKAAYLLKRFY